LIDFIQGKVIYRDTGKVVIDLNGVGISINIPDNLSVEGKVLMN